MKLHRLVFCGGVVLPVMGLLLTGCQATQAGAWDAASSTALERAITFLQVQSRSADPAIRSNCIEALQPSKDPRAEEVIDAGLHDPAWVVRFAAAMAMGHRKTHGYKTVLENLATNDPNDSVKVAAIYALRQLGDTANMNTLARTLRSPDPAVRANTALVLGMMGDPSAIELLNTIRVEPEAPVRFEIVSALARLGDPRAKSIIISMALSKYAEDQYAAMRVCADLPEDAATPLIMGLKGLPANVPEAERAEAEKLTTRRQLVAARALGMRNSIQGLDVAEKNINNPDAENRALAAMALGEMIHGSGVRVLVPLLDDADVHVRIAAAEAIVNVGSRRGGGVTGGRGDKVTG